MTVVSNTPFALSLSKGCPFSVRCAAKKRQGFDKLSLSGFGESR
jgi:hypothetical protein